jgi:hypothetical protein
MMTGVQLNRPTSNQMQYWCRIARNVAMVATVYWFVRPRQPEAIYVRGTGGPLDLVV